jgi:hypothetical protein
VADLLATLMTVSSATCWPATWYARRWSENPREVGVGDGQHRSQPEQSPDQLQHEDGRRSGDWWRGDQSQNRDDSWT